MDEYTTVSDHKPVVFKGIVNVKRMPEDKLRVEFDSAFMMFLSHQS